MFLKKTIQRDLNDIRAYLSNNVQVTGFKEVVYLHDKKGYALNKKSDILKKEDVLAIIKILLESRAFCKEELKHLINSILLEINTTQKREIVEIIENELFNYVPLQHNSLLLTKIWDLSCVIRSKKVLKINYKRADGLQVMRKIKPISIIFSEYYFYLIAYLNDLDTPTIYRIDRIKDYEKMEENFQIPYSERFEDDELRRRIQFMNSGKLMKIKFEFSGGTLEAIMDRLPTSKIIKQVGDTFIIEAEAYGNGILMWFLSQGSKVKVLSPDSLVNKMIEEMKKLQTSSSDLMIEGTLTSGMLIFNNIKRIKFNKSYPIIEELRKKGRREGYKMASIEYEEKLFKQAKAFLKQDKKFQSEANKYMKLIDDY